MAEHPSKGEEKNALETVPKKNNQPVKDAQVLKLLEEDEDDFEQFQEDAYADNPPQKIESKQWREDWDDEDINDDFVSQLKKQLQA